MKQILFFALCCILSSIAVAQQGIENPFFDKVNYRGAFDATNNWIETWTNWDAENTNYPATTITKNAAITADETWTASNVYKIEGFLYVESGATLTIEAGTIIRGDKASKGTLIIERGAKLIANGTKEKPIVFTSNAAAGERDYGDWGGIILCGKAPINVPAGQAQIEGGPRSNYGGTDANDNSGYLQYVRIEFPGIPFAPDKEINGLTLGGVGDATTLSHIQVYRCGDDAFEWFGGTVNAKYLVAAFTWDDDFDTDYGFNGKIQFAVALRDSSIADPGSGSNGFESDNDGSGSVNTPITNPVFSNVSMFGPKVTPSTTINANYKRAMHLRRNSKINIYNSVFAGYKDGLFVDGSAARQNLANNEMKLYNITMAGNIGKNFVDDTISVIKNYFLVAERKNDTLVSNADLKISNPFNYTAPDFRPIVGSPLLNNSTFVGVEEAKYELVSNMVIFPNPATSQINVKYVLNENTNVKFEIIDMSGRICNSKTEGMQNGTNISKIEIENLNIGVYFIRMIAGNNINIVKFIK